MLTGKFSLKFHQKLTKLQAKIQISWSSEISAQQPNGLAILQIVSCLFVCFDLGFQISNPVINYRPDPSYMSHMEARE